MAAYDTLDEAYRELVPSLVAYAKKHIYNRDFAIDAVQDAFVKAQIYLNKPKNAGKKVSGFLLKRETIRACRRLNKYSVEVPVDFSVSLNEQTD
jgi:DNA-directed RNA polymerase specialized sigma24 family protein